MKKMLFDLKNMLLAQKQKFSIKYVFYTDILKKSDEEIRLKHFVHWYNHTWNNCRAIEIPIFLKIYDENKDKNILEVGNVLSHYIHIDHDVLDKYEKRKNVINEDIVDFKPKTKYNMVLSISTLEHVGFDEEKKDPFKFMKAIENIKTNILEEGGFLIFSIPLGYNPGMDTILKCGTICFDNVVYYKCERNNEWFPCKVEDAITSNGSNVIMIGVIKKK